LSPLENNQGEERVQLDDGNLIALQPEKQRFKERFQDSPQIKDFCLLTLWEGRAFDEDGTIHWDIVGMVVCWP